MTAYDKDLHAWAVEQAALLRAGRLQEVDVENVAEEIESLGRSERRELVNRLSVLLAHLLKWRYQPDRRGKSWRATIVEQRRRVSQLLHENPSLKPSIGESVELAYETAVAEAVAETDLDFDAFPARNPWPVADILTESFYPD
jgi:hypothetical protein